jgi:hypothetical protein
MSPDPTGSDPTSPGPTRAALPIAAALPPVPPGLAPAPGRWTVVAGNGPSLAQMPPGVALAGDYVVRVNNFFFETRFHLGPRVDLAVLGGDPRVAPFMAETLRRCGDYGILAWTSHDPRVIRAARRPLRRAAHLPMRLRDAHLARALDALRGRYQKEVSTGVFAVLAAHGLGAERIVLAGMDLYSGPVRYPFVPGRRMRALMGRDLGRRGVDRRLHDADLDRAVLAMLAGRGDAILHAAAPTPGLGALMELAPTRAGVPVADDPRTPPADWAGRSGLYPIGALSVLRRGAGWLRARRAEAPRSGPDPGP